MAPSLDLRLRYQYLPAVARAANDAARADALRAISLRDYPEGSRRFVEQAEAAIRHNARLKTTMLPAIDRAIAAGGR